MASAFRRALAPALVFAVALAAHPSPAMEVRVGRVGENGGYLWLEAAVQDLFPPRLREGLRRGMPATLTLHVELWRRRSAWFDKLEASLDRELRVRYDVWSDQYRLERGRSPAFVTASIDSLVAQLERPMSARLAPVASLRPGQRYYVSFSATLKPLTVEDAREIEGWLSGEVQSKRRAGIGAVTGLPLAVFDAVRNFVGLGDQRASAQTADFMVAELEPRSPP
jgi:hypothetical protein